MNFQNAQHIPFGSRVNCYVCNKQTFMMRMARYLEDEKLRWGYLCPSCAASLDPIPSVDDKQWKDDQ